MRFCSLAHGLAVALPALLLISAAFAVAPLDQFPGLTHDTDPNEQRYCFLSGELPLGLSE